MSTPKKLPPSKQTAYAIGQLGWSTLICTVNSLLIYYYVPPEQSGLTALIDNSKILGLFNLFTVSLLIGRLFEAIIDPVVAGFSDRYNGKRGRRIPFMALGMVPAAFFLALMFFAPDPGVSTLNFIWLLVTQFMFYIGFAFYVMPHNALLIELGHNDKERIHLSTLISITYALGIVVSFSGTIIWEVLQEALDVEKIVAFRYTIGIIAAFALVCMALPVFMIREKDYSISQPSDQPIVKAIKTTFQNRRFLQFIGYDFIYWAAAAIIEAGMLYYITVLLGLPESNILLYLATMFGVSFACYPLVGRLANRYGKKNMIQTATLVNAFCFAMIFTLGQLPLPADIQAFVLVGLAGIPACFLGILPNTVLADIAELDALESGNNKEGMFFAARTTMMRVGQTIGFIVFTVLITDADGNVVASGVRLTGIAGFGFSLAAVAIFRMYNERETVRRIHLKRMAQADQQAVKS